MIGLAGPAAILGGFALAGFMIPMAVNGYNGMIEEKAVAQVEAALSKQAREYENTMAANALSAQQTSEGLREGFRQKEAEYLERINEQAHTIEDRMRTDPYSAGNSVAREFGRTLCEISSGSDLDTRQACGIRAAEADLSASSPVVSITPETTEQWRQLCEDTGERDFCEYTIVGFRTGATYELLGYLTQIDRVLQTQDANFDTVVDQIQQIIDMPGPEIDNPNN